MASQGSFHGQNVSFLTKVSLEVQPINGFHQWQNDQPPRPLPSGAPCNTLVREHYKCGSAERPIGRTYDRLQRGEISLSRFDR